jgi:hypothetical protein
MKRKRLSKSLRKYIRKEKARIRREVLNTEEQKKLINEIYQNLIKNYENKRNLQLSDK